MQLITERLFRLLQQNLSEKIINRFCNSFCISAKCQRWQNASGKNVFLATVRLHIFLKKIFFKSPNTRQVNNRMSFSLHGCSTITRRVNHGMVFSVHWCSTRLQIYVSQKDDVAITFVISAARRRRDIKGIVMQII